MILWYIPDQVTQMEVERRGDSFHVLVKQMEHF